MGHASFLHSCRFISCKALQSGGGFYHNSNITSSSLTVTESFFTNNVAEYVNDTDPSYTRGGGAFEDYRYVSYTSQYSFSFFSGNTAPNGVGNDISIHTTILSLNNIIHCVSKAQTDSFWNTKYEGYDDWLPLGDIRYIKNNGRDTKKTL